jgi:uncharacterized protein YoxC
MSDHDSVLLEDINHKFDAIMEGQAAMTHLPAAVAKLHEDMNEVKTDIKAIKAVLKDHSKLHNQHSWDIAELRRAIT